ncbi:hypothetical protein NDU88_004235 [Pleurodeles waltl]|uniref:Uncharacterized protein n=1 Tax=Pleurodeles waltl TaxID=8319 RepID=A0AAV7VJ93_PLEWA|nr:hypothetical protein NDU88_004235 [Pleurodeles waltl]
MSEANGGAVVCALRDLAGEGRGCRSGLGLVMEKELQASRKENTVGGGRAACQKSGAARGLRLSPRVAQLEGWEGAG